MMVLVNFRLERVLHLIWVAPVIDGGEKIHAVRWIHGGGRRRKRKEAQLIRPPIKHAHAHAHPNATMYLMVLNLLSRL